MSNVTPDEIIDLVCGEFRVKRIELNGRWFGNFGKSDWPPALKARKVALFLIQRHTRETVRHMLGRFALSANNPGRVRLDAIDIECRIAADAHLRAAIDAIEDKIDGLHETRAALAEQQPGRRAFAHA